MVTILLIILFSSLIQGTVGFGFSMIAVPLLSMMMPLTTIVPLLIIIGLGMNGFLLYQLRRDVDFAKMKWLLIAGIMTTPVGASLLTIIDSRVLKLIVGIVIISSAIFMYGGYKIKVKSEVKGNIIAGTLSGLLNGSLTLSGPPVIFFLNNQGTNKQTFRANLAFYFLTLNIFTTITFILKHMFNVEILRLSAISIPLVLLGSWMGTFIGNKVREDIFKKITILGIGIMGIISMINGAVAFL